MSDFRNIFIIVVGLTVLSLTIFFAFIGLIFMLVTHEPTTTDTCDKIVNNWCMARLDNNEDVRIQRTINPQETVDWRANAKQ